MRDVSGKIPLLVVGGAVAIVLAVHAHHHDSAAPAPARQRPIQSGPPSFPCPQRVSALAGGPGSVKDTGKEPDSGADQAAPSRWPPV
jgi:hypothetical protein